MTMIEIRRALPEESESLSAIAHASKRHWDYPESWIAAWSENLTLTPTFIEQNQVFVAASRDRAVACYALTELFENGDLELEHFWLHPDQIGQGLGRRLFDHATAQGRGLGAKALLIDSDPHAEAFYAHMGAARIGATRADIEGVRRELPRMRFEL